MKSGDSTLSLCMIVKNEEDLLRGCLKSVRNFVDEIIVVDTGSTDKTIDIARHFDAQVYRHRWENNFAKHRNQSISYAKGDWIFILDADEEVIRPSGKFLGKAISDETADSIAVQVINLINKGTEFATFNSVRIFKNNSGIKYEGIVHNQEVGCSNTKFYPIQILHHGYNLDGEKTKAKFDRTSALLKRQIAQEPDNPLPHHYLAVSYMSMGTSDTEYYRKAIEESALAIKLAGKKHNNDPAYLGTHYVAAASHFNLGNMDKAEFVCREALKIFPNHMDSYFLLARIYEKSGNYQEAYSCADRNVSIRKAVEDHPEQFGKIINNTFSDEEIHTVFIHVPDYDEKITQYQINYARRGNYRPFRTEALRRML